MKILYAAKTSLAGVCELMARCMKQYHGYDARVLNAGPGRHAWYLRADCNRPRTASIKVKNDVNEALEWADVIHCMANVSAKSMGRLDLLDKKVWVFQWHGAQVWPFGNVWDRAHYRKVKWIHIGQGWIERQWDFFKPFFDKFNAKVVPNVISIDDSIHLPLPWNRRDESVVFSPSTLKKGGVNDKGVDVVTKAMRGFRSQLISKQSFETAMRMKQRAQLGIDEVSTPMYHRSGLEFLSQGVPCICSYNEDTERVLKNAVGSYVMPFVKSDCSNLHDTIKAYFMLSDGSKRAESIRARAWIETFYHPRDLLKRYLEVYVA